MVYTIISSQGRIYFLSNICERFDIDCIHISLTRDPDNTHIIISKQLLLWMAQISVAKIRNLGEGDKVKIYKSADDEIVIEPT